MKNSPILYVLLGTLLLWAMSSCFSENPPGGQEVTMSPADSLQTILYEMGNDSQAINGLLQELRPVLFSPISERTLEDWYVSKTTWEDRFKNAETIRYCAELVFEEYSEENELYAAARVKNAIGRMHDSDGEYSKALESYELSYELAQRQADSVNIAWNLYFISIALVSLNDLDACLSYSGQALRLSRELNEPAIEASALTAQSAAWAYQGNFDTSLQRIAQSLAVAKASGLRLMEKRGIINKSYALNHLGRFDESIDFLEQHIDLNDLPVSITNTFLCFNLQGAHLGRKEYQKAIYYLELGNSMAKELGYIYAQFHGEQYRTILYEEVGLFEKALAASERMQQLEGKYTGLAKAKAVESFKSRLRLLEKNLEIEALDKATKDKQLAYRRRIQAYVYLTGLMALFIPILFLLMRNWNRVTLVEKKQELAEVKLQLLRTQLHPQLILKNLNSVKNYIMESGEIEAYNYVGKFAMLLRILTKGTHSVGIELDQEALLLQSFLEMEQLQRGEAFEFTLQLSAELAESERSIPSLIVLPFLEDLLARTVSTPEDKRTLEISFDHNATKTGAICTIMDSAIVASSDSTFTQEKSNKGQRYVEIYRANGRLESLAHLGHEGLEYNVVNLAEAGEVTGTKISISLPYIIK